MRLGVFVLGGLLLLPARAATVEVSVRERQGGVIANQRVFLQPTLLPGEVPTWTPTRMDALTGPGGKVTFERVPVGRYTVSLGAVAGGLIHPSANPAEPPTHITITTEKDKVAVEIEVWRGSLLSGEIVVDRASIPRGAKVKVRSLDDKRDGELALDAQGHVEYMLAPGRYELELVAPPGYVLVDIVWNGESVPGHVVRFDVREDTRRQSVSWYLSATCLITGKVADAWGECPARIVATLVQPGPWIQTALERGGSTFQVVPNQEWVENNTCVYRLWLPEGQWTVQPQGEAVLTSDPEKVDVAIAPWETRSLDFRLTTKEGEGGKGQPLVVSVRSPRGRAVTGAAVEVWPVPAEGATAPLQTGTTGGQSGTVSFRGLEAGNYVVAAGHEAFLDGTAKVEGYDPKADAPKRVTVTLSMGVKLHGHAVDESGRSVPGVELSYTRLDPLPKTALLNEGVLSKKRSGAALTDATGHAEVRSLYPGSYRLNARMTGEKDATRFVVFRNYGTKGKRSVDVSLTEDASIELLVLPAASLSGGLMCSDRGTMPPQVSFRIFAAESPVVGLWRDAELASGAEFSSDDDVLRGPGADRFHLGPLSTGAYRLAARPAGQRYWSWASNELVPDNAAVFSADQAQAVDAGIAEIECGPLLPVVPTIKSGEPVPDLRLGTVRASLRPSDDRAPRGREPYVEIHADRVFVRRLRDGKFRTTVTVEHPYLIPSSISVPEQVLDLKRGDLVPIPVTFERLGGMVEVRGEGTTARLTPAEGDPVLRPIADGKASFPGTIPGTYRVELCAADDCSKVTATWSVSVGAGKTTYVPER